MVALFFLDVDEQTIGFQGRHVDKMIIFYKNEGGGGVQADAIYNRGYPYAIFLSNEVSPQKYTPMLLSTLHHHVLFISNTLQ